MDSVRIYPWLHRYQIYNDLHGVSEERKDGQEVEGVHCVRTQVRKCGTHRHSLSCAMPAPAPVPAPSQPFSPLVPHAEHIDASSCVCVCVCACVCVCVSHSFMTTTRLVLLVVTQTAAIPPIHLCTLVGQQRCGHTVRVTHTHAHTHTCMRAANLWVLSQPAISSHLVHTTPIHSQPT